MQLLTNSRRKAYAMCPEYHHIAYVEGIRPVQQQEQLTFGSAFHAGLEAIWQGQPIAARYLSDPYENARLMALLAGYVARWADSDRRQYRVLGVEKEFETPLVHPITGEEHPYWRLAGKVDAIVVDGGEETILVEHKTSGEDISPGTTYWRRLDLDTQILTYLVGAGSLGFTIRKVMYDVAAKPRQRPKKEETAVQFERRILQAIAEAPTEYYQRGDLHRTQEQVDRMLLDLWAYADKMQRDIEDKWHPRNVDSCFKYNRPCQYFDVCCGLKSLHSPEFVKGEINPELRIAA